MSSLKPEQALPTVTENQSKNYNGIDLVKFLCAIMVFTIHIPPFQGQISTLAKYVNFGFQHYLCRLAVPFYFAASGFLLFRKMSPYEVKPQIVKNYCFKLLLLLGFWHVVLFVGGTGHLWYLGATVVAVTLLSFCFYLRIRFRYLCIIACLLYGIGLLGCSYYGLIAPLTEFTVFKYLTKGYFLAFESTRNGVFMGFPFVLIGAIFAYREIKIKPRTALAGLVVSVLCLFAEVFLVKYNDLPIEYNMYVFLLPATFFLFSFACSVQLKDHIIYKRLRKMGTIIYFLHFLIGKFVYLGIRVMDKFFGINAAPFHFVLTLICTILFAVFAEWLSRKEKFQWINWFLA